MSNHFITLQEAKNLTQRYRNLKDEMVTDNYTNSLSISETFDADAIQAILNQPGCTGFRAYFGMKEDNKVCLIFVGVDNNDVDILNGNENSVIVELGRLCPPKCSPTQL